MSASAFAVGQRVAVLSGFHSQTVDVISTIEKVTHNGSRVHVVGVNSTFDCRGYSHADKFMRRRIVLATAQHEEASERRGLWTAIDRGIASPYGDIRAEARAAVSTEKLRAIVKMLDGDA